MKPHPFLEQIAEADFTAATGAVTRVTSAFIEADGPIASVGDLCEIEPAEGEDALLAEVVALEAALIRLVPIARAPRLNLGAKVRTAGHIGHVAVGDAFAGRAVDGLGQPIDGSGVIERGARKSRGGTPLAPLDRVTPREPLVTGLRAIDALLPLGKGQRVGIFAASGVGKTSMIEQIARQADCDRMVMCLVGERGREVDALWSMFSETGHCDRSTLVAATADESPSMRLRAVDQAVGLAEHWRDRGEHVLLIVDSVTRAAQALREIGLASGLPPTVRGLTPNVFSALPRLVERCGAARAGGAITAIFTVLSETDDVDDPVVELMKSVLDGHIVLSRSLAEKRHFPAIDVTRSVSRLAGELLDPEALDLLHRAHGLIATFDEARPMIESGLYRTGASTEIDRAIALHPPLDAFLRQAPREWEEVSRTRERLRQILDGGAHE